MPWMMIVTAVAACASFALSLLVALRKPLAGKVDGELLSKLVAIEQASMLTTSAVRDEGKLARDELRSALAAHQQSLEPRLASFAQAQSEQLGAMRQEASDGREKLEVAFKANTDAFAHTQTTRLGETNLAMKDLSERLEKAQEAARDQQKAGLEVVGAKVQTLTETNEKKQDAMREALTLGLDQLRKDNEAKLEQMRATVEEKLQGTLEARLGESFKQVSDRLEQVHKGLGEMQSLATGVGDLKRVLTNVKSRGGWGEMQLGMLLEDMLTPEQYDSNVRVRPDSPEPVEFAIRLPGKGGDDRPIFLPIDAKFPHEDYDRLLAAQESGTPDEMEKAGAALERAVRAQAKIIQEKYIHPPYSTDFGIMYLPTEGLYAEIIRRPGLGRELQTKYRVSLAGPTTLAAQLNSLQMGFRTLAIEKRSSEVWKVLSTAKSEFGKYGEVWDKLGKQLAQAQDTVAKGQVRTRAVERALRKVETVESPDPVGLLDAGSGVDVVQDTDETT